MRISEALSIQGRFILTASDPKTGLVVARIGTSNMILTTGKELVGDLIIARASYTVGVTYCALGAGTTAPALSDTQLEDEGGGAAMRKTISTRSRTSTTVTLSTFFLASESTLAIEEVGTFGYPATGTENSGTMFNRALLSYDNSGATYDITIDVVLSL